MIRQTVIDLDDGMNGAVLTVPQGQFIKFQTKGYIGQKSDILSVGLLKAENLGSYEVPFHIIDFHGNDFSGSFTLVIEPVQQSHPYRVIVDLDTANKTTVKVRRGQFVSLQSFTDKSVVVDTMLLGKLSNPDRVVSSLVFYPDRKGVYEIPFKLFDACRVNQLGEGSFTLVIEDSPADEAREEPDEDVV